MTAKRPKNFSGRVTRSSGTHGKGRRILNEGLVEAITLAAADGHYWTVIERHLGLGKGVIRYWRWKGAKDLDAGRDTREARLRQRTDQALAPAEVKAVSALREAGTHDRRAAASFLRRRFPKRWSRT